MMHQSELGCINPAKVGPVAMHIIDGIQGYPHEEQAAAMALAFIVLCTKLKCRPSEIMQTANNILERSVTQVPEIRALKGYVADHLLSRAR